MKSNGEKCMNIPEHQHRLLDELKHEISFDTFNLSRDDQAAIELQINKLEKFIEKKYEMRKTL